ncbi:class I SAM-dependent methyltransferase [Halolamina sp. C58]|uniref:class I SAM-dependent methyltransferase n=1 Tax=Halolamina sp. C58 TaxID=3421640 RepID=UPI003EBECE8C
MPEEFTPEAYYDEYGEREWHRLDRDLYGELEHDETWHYLDRHLPESGRVLDAGGGAGRYSVELADRGYEVTLVDRSSEQVALAREHAADHGVADAVTARTGDVRDLAAATDGFDATLCLGGPLSHVLDPGERRDAAAELRRVTAPGGPVFVSVMGRLAALQTIARMAGRVEPDADETEILPRVARTGDYDAELLEAFDLEPAGPPMHLFRAHELRELLQHAGLTVHTVTGLESVASQRRDEFDALDDDHREAIRETVATLRGDPGVADLSGHMLAVAIA